MPWKSDQQRKWAYATGQPWAKEWDQNYNNGGIAMLNKEHAANELAYIARTQGRDAAMSVVKAYENMLTPQDIEAAMGIINMNCGGKVGYNDGGPIEPLAESTKGTFKAQATRMGMSIPKAARSILDAPEGRYTPEMRRKANFALNARGWDKRNKGGLLGNAPMYNEGGMLTNHPYNREGEQFDTVPAMLTPGEFVVDADSAHRFGDELEQINNWEPTPADMAAETGDEKFIAEDEAVEIKRKFKDGTEIIVKSPEGSKTEVSGLLSSLTKTAKREGYDPVKQGMLRANTGLLVPGAITSEQLTTPGGILGTPQIQPTGILTPEQQAQARSQQFAGAALAGLGSQSGSYLAGMGRRALEGHQAALAGQEDSASTDSQAEVVRISKEAGQLLQAASTAGDLINGYVKLSDEEEQSIKDQVGNFVSSIAQTVAGGFEQTRRIREEARARIVSAAHPQSYSAYVRLKALANQMVFPVLESGALGVNPTDADVELAKSSQFDVTAPSSSWADQLNALIVRNGGQGDVPQVTYTETAAPAATPQDDVAKETAPAETAAAEPAETVADKVVDTAGAVKDAVTTKVTEVFAGKGSGTSEDPYVIPITKATKSKALDWLEKQDLNEDSIIRWRGITGTVSQLMEYLTREG